MKVIIIHGDHIVESYTRLQKLIEVAKGRGWEIKRISDDTVSLPEELVSVSLFEKERLIIIENINLVRKKDIQWFNKNSRDLTGTLIIYHQGTIPATLIKSFSPDKIEEFKLPKIIWIFLDTLSPGNARNSLNLLHKIIKNEPVEFVFALLARHLRDLYWTKEGPESMPYPSWKVIRLKRQASKFSKEELKELIKEMAEADIRAKTSKEQLLDSLDFLIATKLE